MGFFDGGVFLSKITVKKFPSLCFSLKTNYKENVLDVWHFLSERQNLEDITMIYMYLSGLWKCNMCLIFLLLCKSIVHREISYC